MKNIYLIFLILFLGCTESHFISDENHRNTVEKDFNSKLNLFKNKSYFDYCFRKDIGQEEREALKFLYAYMPLGDVTDYSKDFYLENVKYSFKARKEMSWGDSIPEEIFRHFVLPVRVGNETLDSARIVFYNELKDRVKGKSLYDAALEVNHWCHEKANYRPSDMRTSSPLATVKTAYGRCGEESVLGVAALRAVGIPARQVYTPRWAHTDDNHAWVEVWVNGKWYYLGACEPAPRLNMAWFDSTVKRGILMYARAFGRYEGYEEVITKNECFTEVNVTSNYAPTSVANVIVKDVEGQVVENAKVEFKIYNYAELFSAIKRKTNQQGIASISAGKGDFVVWASKGNRFGIAKIDMRKDKQITVVLDKKVGDRFKINLDITPPIAQNIDNIATKEEVSINNKRLADEDDIRNKYVNGFISKNKVYTLAKTLNISGEDLWKYVYASRGNWENILGFILKTKQENIKMALSLLGVISQKDLRDISMDILKDHLENTDFKDDELFTDYILNPRVANEMLSPYRNFIQKWIPVELVKSIKENPRNLVEWCKKLDISDEINPRFIPQSPRGIVESGITDTWSRDIFFVSVCRTLGIASRINPVNKALEFYRNGIWNTVKWDNKEELHNNVGGLNLRYNSSGTKNPYYDTHFTIANIGDASPVTLTYNNKEGLEGSVSYWEYFYKPIKFEAGNYILTTGTRMASGKVLVELKSFNIDRGKISKVVLSMRKDEDDIQVLGSMNPEALFTTLDGKESSILSITGRGYFVLGILGAGDEPSKHSINDISLVKSDFEKWERSIIVLLPNEKTYQKVNKVSLPSNLTWGIDSKNIAKDIISSLDIPKSNNMPIFLIADSFGRVVYISYGYKIGIGEHLIRVINKL